MIRVVRDLASNKTAKDVEKNAYVHFVDERDLVQSHAFLFIAISTSVIFQKESSPQLHLV